MKDPRSLSLADFPQDGEWREKIIFLLRWGVLAPSTHNSQPWLFRIEGNAVKICNDPNIAIERADPVKRDLFISFGCLIENVAIAARALGLAAEIRYAPPDGMEEIAEIRFSDGTPDPEEARLAEEIPRRVNVRGLFEKRGVPPEKAAALGESIFPGIRLDLLSDPARIEKIAGLTREGLRLAYRDPRFREEMSGWVISNFSSRREGIPGYSLRLPALLSLVFPWFVQRFDIGSRVGHLNYLSMRSAPLVAVWSAEEDGPAAWLDIGRAGERMMLRARTLGLKTSIFVAAVEMGELHEEVRKLTGSAGRPQFVLCVGYMDRDQRPSPRHPAEEKIIS